MKFRARAHSRQAASRTYTKWNPPVCPSARARQLNAIFPIFGAANVVQTDGVCVHAPRIRPYAKFFFFNSLLLLRRGMRCDRRQAEAAATRTHVNRCANE